MMETVFLRAGWFIEKIDDDAGEWFSLLCRLCWTGLCESSEHSVRLKAPLDETRKPNDETFSLIFRRWWRSGVKACVADLDEGECWLALASASMLSRLRAGEKGFFPLLRNELRSTKSFSIDSEHELSLRQGLMGQGRGLDGGLLLAKKEMSSDVILWKSKKNRINK